MDVLRIIILCLTFTLVASRSVSDAPKKQIIESYNHLFEIHGETLNLWYFPSQLNSSNAPVIFWFGDGERSALVDAFTQGGPYSIEFTKDKPEKNRPKPHPHPHPHPKPSPCCKCKCPSCPSSDSNDAYSHHKPRPPYCPACPSASPSSSSATVSSTISFSTTISTSTSTMPPAMPTPVPMHGDDLSDFGHKHHHHHHHHHHCCPCPTSSSLPFTSTQQPTPTPALSLMNKHDRPDSEIQSFELEDAYESVALISNPLSWTKFAHVVYFDFAAGFARQNSKEIPIQNVASKLCKMHPKLFARDLYFGGKNFGSNIAASLVENMHYSNFNDMNVKGLVLSLFVPEDVEKSEFTEDVEFILNEPRFQKELSLPGEVWYPKFPESSSQIQFSYQLLLKFVQKNVKESSTIVYGRDISLNDLKSLID